MTIKKIIILILLLPILWPFYLLILLLWLLEELSIGTWLIYVNQVKDKDRPLYNKMDDEVVKKIRKRMIKLILLAPILWPIYIIILIVKLYEELMFALSLYTLPMKRLSKIREKMRLLTFVCYNEVCDMKLYDRMNRIDNRWITLDNRRYKKEHPNPGPGRHREHGWYLDNDD